MLFPDHIQEMCLLFFHHHFCQWFVALSLSSSFLKLPFYIPNTTKEKNAYQKCHAFTNVHTEIQQPSCSKTTLEAKAKVSRTYLTRSKVTMPLQWTTTEKYNFPRNTLRQPPFLEDMYQELQAVPILSPALSHPCLKWAQIENILVKQKRRRDLHLRWFVLT